MGTEHFCAAGFGLGRSFCLWQCRSTAHTGQAHTVGFHLCCGCGSAAAATWGTSNHKSTMWVCHPPGGWWMLSLCHIGLLPGMQMRGSCHPSSCADPPLPINKTAPCKGRWFSQASATLTQQCCISGCLVLFYPCWYLQCFVKYRYLGFVVLTVKQVFCFNSQTSASSSKLSLRFFKSFAWGSAQIASGHIPCYLS